MENERIEITNAVEQNDANRQPALHRRRLLKYASIGSALLLGGGILDGVNTVGELQTKHDAIITQMQKEGITRPYSDELQEAQDSIRRVGGIENITRYNYRDLGVIERERVFRKEEYARMRRDGSDIALRLGIDFVGFLSGVAAGWTLLGRNDKKQK